MREPKEVAEWMKKEHERVEELSNNLRRLIAVTPRSDLTGWIKKVTAAFGDFHANCTKHFALEEEDGYLEPVLERQPGLAGRIERLKNEHVEMNRIMDSIADDVKQLGPHDRFAITDICERIRLFLGYIDEHERLENTIVSYAFSTDIGTTD